MVFATGTVFGAFGFEHGTENASRSESTGYLDFVTPADNATSVVVNGIKWGVISGLVGCMLAGVALYLFHYGSSVTAAALTTKASPGDEHETSDRSGHVDDWAGAEDWRRERELREDAAAVDD